MPNQQSESCDLIEQLVMSVQSSANWRLQKAQQFPEDKRNSRSAASLEILAQNLETLRPYDPGFAAYAEVVDRAVAFDVLSSLVETENRYVGRYGFDYPQNGDPTKFLTALTEEVCRVVEAAEERAAEAKREEEFEAAQEEADEAAKKQADEIAKTVAEDAAKDAANEAHKRAYDEAYGEAYRKALIDAMEQRRACL